MSLGIRRVAILIVFLLSLQVLHVQVLLSMQLRLQSQML